MTAYALDVRELSCEEINDVAGGPGPLVVLIPFIPHIIAGVTVIAGATIAAVSHLRSDDCTTVTTVNGNTTTETKHCT
jgi:hypothetical protein